MRHSEKTIKAVEAHGFKVTAMVDDGSLMLVPVSGKSVIGSCFRLTPAKVKALAKLAPLTK